MSIVSLERTAAAAALLVVMGAATPARADTLAVPPTPTHRAAHASSGMPVRGMSMKDVERRFGAPLDRLPAAGGDSPRHPTIHRWRYDGYTVYFERSRVIHSVADAAGSTPNA